MSKNTKRKERLLNSPKDYTYDEARALLEGLGFEEMNKGKTSGSRVRFFRKSDSRVIDLHKPHPGNIMKEYAVDNLRNFLIEIGEL